MQNSHVRRAMRAEIERIVPTPTQQELERIIGVAQSTLSQYLNGRRLPDQATLRVLATHWPDSLGGLRILIAYLHDVVDRAGRPDEVDIQPRDHATPLPAEIAADISLLREECRSEPSTAAMIHGICQIIRQAKNASAVTYPKNSPRQLRAAERKATYGK